MKFKTTLSDGSERVGDMTEMFKTLCSQCEDGYEAAVICEDGYEAAFITGLALICSGFKVGEGITFFDKKGSSATFERVE